MPRETSRKPTVCTPFAKTVCKPLADRVGVFGGKGIVVMRTMNFRTGQDGRSYVIYKTHSTDKGTVMNFCPFCGGKLYKESPDAP